MRMRYRIVLAIVLILGVAGFFVPLGEYTPTKGVCPYGDPPVMRLHVIYGESLQKIKDSDIEPPPNVGCAAQFKYVLYAL